MVKLKTLNDNELKEFKKSKPLYKPVKSTRVSKKGMVYVVKDDKVRLIHFGDANMEDFTQHNDEKRRKSYLARAKGIRNREGNPTYLDKNMANYYSVRYLWQG
jgi:hypothetical protein